MFLVRARGNANADRASWAATSKLQIEVSGFAPRLTRDICLPVVYGEDRLDRVEARGKSNDAGDLWKD